METEKQFGNMKQGTVIGNINDKEFEACMEKEQEEKRGGLINGLLKRC